MNIADASQVRAAEKKALAGDPEGYGLMLCAGRAAARIIEEFFPRVRRTVVLCGGGNNGGDALVAAASLPGEVVVYALRPLSELRGAAACAARDLPERIEVHVCETLSPDVFRFGDLIVDGVLGIGFSGGPLRGPAASFLRAAASSGCPVAALDVPSGLDADTGIAAEAAVRADLTVTFGAVKKGLLLGQGPALCGVLRAVDIGLGGVSCDDRAVTFEEAVRLLPRPGSDVHKNSRGALLVVAGSSEFSGAAALTATAALRCGAGIVRLACVKAAALPCAVIAREFPAENGLLAPAVWRSLAPWIRASDALAAGPGWGPVSPGLLQGVFDFPGPVVLDADALNAAARNPELWRGRPDMVITPHPGEAARLARAFGVAGDGRSGLARGLAAKLGTVVLLKGKFTVVASPDGREKIILAGSPALATAGSGDVLTGVIGALLASGVSPFDAAVLGASLHGRAGELAGRGAVSDDLPLVLRDILRDL
ncbi:MAG: NAD(P)H-hydrate dehydratase [Lentisphaeria bacterium]|nr:NAD(P)H-hydrate dehydratase [Lentisphaeria bacterium]